MDCISLDQGWQLQFLTKIQKLDGQRLRLPEPRCSGGPCQHPCPSPSRLSGLFGVHGALGGEAYPNEKLLIAGLPMAAIPL
jgi:hypothetical protein